MYPATYFSLFPPFPRDDNIFVAMSFAPQFQRRWETVIRPAIESVTLGGAQLKPLRVDQRTISDSILTEILEGIGRSRMVFADITTMHASDGGAFRNGNVMYELGIAHAMRLPAEVVIFRSDNDRLLFDMSQVRVNTYDPDADPNSAIKRIQDAVLGALREVDLQRAIAVRQAISAMDANCLAALIRAASGEFQPERLRTMGEFVSGTNRAAAYARLLEMGIFQCRISRPDPTVDLDSVYFEDLVAYSLTPFGQTVFRSIAQSLDLLKILKRREGRKETNDGSESDLLG